MKDASKHISPYVDIKIARLVIPYIKQAQKDAYNQALKDATKSATARKKEVEYTGMRTGGTYFINVVDKQSILKLKIK